MTKFRVGQLVKLDNAFIAEIKRAYNEPTNQYMIIGPVGVSIVSGSRLTELHTWKNYLIDDEVRHG